MIVRVLIVVATMAASADAFAPAAKIAGTMRGGPRGSMATSTASEPARALLAKGLRMTVAKGSATGEILQDAGAALGSGGVSSSEEVPVIDLRNTDDEALVEQIAQACRVYGFLQVTNHGVEGIDHFRDVCKSWFTSDKPKKRRNGTNARGYFDDELTKQRRDWKQALDVGVPGSRDWNVPDDDPSNACLDGLNQFPEGDAEDAHLRETVVEYFEACAALSHRLAVIMAAGVLGCGLAEAESSSMVQDLKEQHTSYLRMNYYPTCDENTVEAETKSKGTPPLGISPHRDAGFLTVLLQDDDCHSLQVLFGDDEWHTVHPVPGALTINTGDMAQIWSNGRYSAPLHRVLTSPTKTRFSAPFFYNPGYPVTVEPVLAGLNKDTPRLYHPCLWGYFRAVRFAGDLTDLGVEIQTEDYLVQGDSKHVAKQDVFASKARFDEAFSVERFRDLLVG